MGESDMAPKVAPLPNAVIVGVPKAATTTLFDILAAHPEVCAATAKETHYFTPLRYGEPMQELSAYRTYFRHYAGEPVVLEATPGYFYGGTSLAEAMHESMAGLKVIVVLRDPVTRLFSYFTWQQSRLALPAGMTLAQYVEACDGLSADPLLDRRLNAYAGLRGGVYADHLPVWHEYFRGRMQVVFFEDLVADPGPVLKTLAEWLGLDPAHLPSQLPRSVNPTQDNRSRRVRRLALVAGRTARPVLRKHPDLVHTLRALHHAVNSKPLRRAVMDETVGDQLRRRYEEPNRALAAQLTSGGFAQTPPWLREQLG